jgi:hypothetical protein
MVIEGTRQKSIEKAAARLPGLVAPAEPPRIGIYRMIALQEEPY